tara:strand:+ start:1207 stop:1470 length:264 start_codon:yes stop_codon:yes gene_type:complete
MDNTKPITLEEIKKDLNDVMNAADAGSINLLLTMSVALSATAQNLINTEQLLKITDMVEATSLMETGLTRDLSFEKARKLLKEMIQL